MSVIVVTFARTLDFEPYLFALAADHGQDLIQHILNFDM
jgi:hypothetical protein